MRFDCAAVTLNSRMTNSNYGGYYLGIYLTSCKPWQTAKSLPRIVKIIRYAVYIYPYQIVQLVSGIHGINHGCYYLYCFN